MSQPRVTLNECARIVGQLEPRLGEPSYWQLRALDEHVGAVDSSRVVLNDRATTRLLDPLDVAIVRLWWRMVSETVQPGWVPGAVISMHRHELRDALRRRLDRALVLRGLRSRIVPVDVETTGERYPLADVPSGVVEAMTAIRFDKPTIWNGCRPARVADVRLVPSSELCEVI